MQIAGEETLQALRNANDALVELSSETPPSSRRNKRKADAEAAGRKVHYVPVMISTLSCCPHHHCPPCMHP